MLVMGELSTPISAHGAIQPTLAPAPIEVLIAQGQLHLGGREIDAKALKPFYAPRTYQAAWSDAKGNYDLERFSNDIRAVADEHGLNAESYALIGGLPGAETDLCISDALARLGRDLATGRIAPYRIIGGMGESLRPHFEPTAFLRKIQLGTPLHDVANQTAPHNAAYLGLEQALKIYRDYAKAGGWQAIAPGQPIKPGESDPRIAQIRKRLMITGDLPKSDAPSGEDVAASSPPEAPTPVTATPESVASASAPQTTAAPPEAIPPAPNSVLDDTLVAALKRFQLRHGLEPDGAVGKRTLATLNVSASQRVRQIELTMERQRQLPRDRAPNRVEVNIASQILTLYQGNMPELSMRVVVGDAKHQTPGMMTRVATLTVNPSWTVPASIARKEILPKLKRDPKYLSNNNIRLMDPSASDTPDLDGTIIDWSQMKSSFPYVLRQRPGPDNALGQLKFNLQDQDAIYMHDTPQKTFFKRSYRALSHGCIRLEHPLDLAARLLSPHWQSKLPDLLADTKTATLGLAHSIPVYLDYITVWVDADGTIAFRDDIYGNDYRLDEALRHGIPLSEIQHDSKNL